MLDHTDPVASVIPAASLDAAAPENAMTALSRLALGPVNTDYYLAVFDRFDTTGRTTTTWNWAACLATINWMLFRQLWTAALVYVAAAEGLALLLFGVGRSFIHWPPGVELGVLGAFAMLAFVVPGFYGNAILYADIRKRVGRALAASRTLPEAAALLQRQASSRQRLRRLVAANVVLAGAAALAWWLWSSPSAAPPLALEPAVTAAQATAASAPAAASSKPAVTAVPAPSKNHSAFASGPVAGPDEPASAPATSASTPASTPAPTAAMASAARPPIVAASASAVPASATAPKAAAMPPASTAAPARPAASVPAAPVQPAASSATAPSTAARSQPASQAPAHGAAAAPRNDPASRSAPVAKPGTPAKSSRTPPPAPAASVAAAPATAPSLAASETPPPVGTLPGYYINVGLFADESNARKAQARLLNEGLPAFRQELEQAGGRRIRVRVGPYATRAQADAAAASIRAMALEAVVFRQR